MNNWLDSILEITTKLESPRSYWFWSLLCSLSAVVKDHVYIDRGGAYRLYPNIYVLLHGGSGLGKGLPIAFSRQLVEQTGCTRVISGRSSIEAVLSELATAQSTPSGVIADSAGFIAASEFSAALIQNPMAITILTDLFDRIYHQGTWKNLLKSGTEKLKNPTVTLLGGVNEAQFRDALTNRDMQGGFLGRTFLIRETKRNTLNPLTEKLDQALEPKDHVEHLKKLAKVKGEFTVTDEAKLIYNSWYKDYYGQEESEEETGTSSRLRDSVWKVSMLLSLSVDDSLVITAPLISTAIRLTEPLVPSARRAVMSKGKSGFAEQTATLINILLQCNGNRISRSSLLGTYWREFDALDLDRIIITLEQSQIIRISQEEQGQLYYQMTEEAREQVLTMHSRRKDKRK